MVHSMERNMTKKPSKRILRGLRWVVMTAYADLEAVADEKGTGQFSGTSASEAAEAIEWLRLLLREAEGRAK